MLFEVKEAKQSKWETNGRRKKNMSTQAFG